MNICVQSARTSEHMILYVIIFSVESCITIRKRVSVIMYAQRRFLVLRNHRGIRRISALICAGSQLISILYYTPRANKSLYIIH